jgi:hypothetical protein
LELYSAERLLSPRTRVWRDDERGGHLVHDAPVIIQSYTSIDAIDRQAPKLREFLVRMGK